MFSRLQSGKMSFWSSLWRVDTAFITYNKEVLKFSASSLGGYAQNLDLVYEQYLVLVNKLFVLV